MIRLYKKYEEMLVSGEYEDLDDLRNALGLNYLDVYEFIDNKDDKHKKEDNDDWPHYIHNCTL